MSDPTPERRSMRGWGRYLGDLDTPQTMQEAMLHAMMAGTDRLLECVTALEDIRMRLARIEIWIESNDEGYNQGRGVPDHRPLLAPPEEIPHGYAALRETTAESEPESDAGVEASA